MKKKVDAYHFNRISPRMAKEFGDIERYLERRYAHVMLPIESNLIRAYRKSGINNGSRAIEAIRICLLTIDGYLNGIEYDLDPHITDENKPYLEALQFCFDPFANELLKPLAEEKCDIHSEEGLHDYFEAPVKCLLRIEKTIESLTKEQGDTGYFDYLETNLGIFITDEKMECVIVKLKKVDSLDEAELTMQDLFPEMNLHEIFMELFPAMTTIFKLGFIPLPNEIYEFTKEQYAAYQKQGGDISKPLYTIVPDNYKYLGPPNEISLLTNEDTFKLGKAAVFLHMYAHENGCESTNSEDVLKYVAERIPAYFTKDTKFARPLMKVLEPGEVPLTENEEIVDLLAHVLGEGTKIDIKITHKDANQNVEKVENITLPIEKKR